MSNYKDFIILIQNDYHQFEKSFKSFLQAYSKIHDFLNILFQWIPFEFFILLILSVIVLLILNSVSSYTKKINIIISVVLIAGCWLVLNKIILGRFKLYPILKSAFMILAPVYIFYYLGYFTSYIAKYFRKKKLASPANIERSIYNVQMAYNESMAQAHLLLTDGNYDPTVLKEKLTILKVASDGLLNSVNKKYNKEPPTLEIQAEVEKTAPISTIQS